MSYQKDRENFLIVLKEEGVPIEKARLVLRHANTIQRIAALQCSVEMSEEEAKRLERRDEMATARIRMLLEPHGVKPNFQGDPRGACVKLLLPKTKKWNSWGGMEDGYCVPTREY